jgi:flagellar biosynthetic protein FliO
MRILSRLGKYRKALLGLGLIVITVLLVSLLVGETTSQEVVDRSSSDLPLAASDTALGGMAMKVIGSVAVMIGILYLSMYAMRRVGRGGTSGGLSQDAISVLCKRHIAPKKAIYVVRVASRAMVVGVTDAQINHLADLTDEELESLKAGQTNKAKDFKRHLLGFSLGMKDRT